MYSQPIKLASKVYVTEAQRLANLANIGEQVAEIAHEARSPLTTILLGLDYCQKLNLAENDQKRISLAMDEAKRLKGLLDDLLAQTKSFSSTCVVLKTRTLELNSLINDTLTLIRQFPDFRQKNINFVSSVPTAWIKGDRDKLKQVFINLVINACEAIEEGEEVLWEIAPGAKKERVCIQIHNNGQPISPHIVSRLGSAWVTTKPKGTGLGLVIAKQLIEAHGGELKINSDVNQGTTVNIDLPLLRLKSIFTPEEITLTRTA